MVVLIKNSAYIFMVLILVCAYCPDVVVWGYVRLVPRPSPIKNWSWGRRRNEARVMQCHCPGDY